MINSNAGRLRNPGLGAAITLALLGGCSTDSGARDTAAVDAVATESAGYQARATTEQAEEKSERMICRRDRPTGSWISETICMTAEDWERISQGSQATIRQAQRAPKSYNDQ